jgi:hypothetical protein
VHALRRIHRGLVPGGILLDMHPVPPSARAEARGVSLGEFDDAEFFGTVAATEAALEETVHAGLFALETELAFDWLERFESGQELIEAASSWEGCRIPHSVADRIRRVEPPVDIWERVVLRRFGSL